MKNNILRIFLFLTIVIVPPILWMGLEKSGSDLYTSLQVELGENRALYTIDDPAAMLTDGSVLTDYYADRAPFRNFLISINRKISSRIERPYDNGIMRLAMKIYNIKEKEVADTDTEEQAVSSDTDDGSAFDNLFGTGDEGAENGSDLTEEAGSDIASNDSSCEHDYEIYYAYPSSCFMEGLYRYRCKACGEVYEETTPKLSHELIYLSDVEASFETYGYSEYVCTLCGQHTRENIVDKLIDSSYLAPTIKDNEVIMGRSGWLFLAGDGNLSYYTRENVLEKAAMKEYADALEKLNNLCLAKGKQFAVIIAPNKDQVYSEYMPTFTYASELRRTETLVNYITDNTNVSISYMLNELKYAGRYWQMYYKYDSHWNKLGAYIGFQALLNLLDRPVTSPFNIRTEQVEIDKVGDLISLGGLEYTDFPKETDYKVDYKPFTDSWSLIDGNWDVMTFYQTAATVDNEDKCVVIGDSYRINLIPYLEKEFSLCSYVYRDNLWEAESAISDANIIVIESVERMDYKLLNTVNALIDYLSR